VEARNQLDALVHSTEKTLKENEAKVPAAEKSEVESALSAARSAMEGQDADAIRQATERLSQAAMKMGEALYKAQQASPPPGGGEAGDGGAGAGATGGGAQGDRVVDAEFEEVSDDAPTFDSPDIPIKKMQGFVPISIEALQDEANVTQVVAELLAEGKDELEAVSLITGTGQSNQPTGIVTALANTAAEIAPVTPETFAIADVYAVYEQLPARHRRRGAFLANNLIYNKIRQFDTDGGAGLWTTLGNGEPPLLLGRPIGEAEAMDATWDGTETADNYVLLYGNFQNFVIADRIGMTVEFIPHLFGGTGQRPTGKRGWFAYCRMGSDVVNPNAFRLLNIETAS